MDQNRHFYSNLHNNIEVNVSPQYVPEKSDPSQKFYLFKYRIIISHFGEQRVQLLSRLWKIRNGNKKEETIRGPGVVGKTPILSKGDTFSYESFCPLSTPSGSMRGSLEFKNLETGKTFDVPIPLFFLRRDH